MIEAEWLAEPEPIAMIDWLRGLSPEKLQRFAAAYFWWSAGRLAPQVLRAEDDPDTGPRLVLAEAYVLPSEWAKSWDPAAALPLLRCLFGNPFRPVTFSPAWRTATAVSLARRMSEARDFSAMPILADALQDAGCDSDEVLTHCRGPGPHVRGCWIVDLVLGKE